MNKTEKLMFLVRGITYGLINMIIKDYSLSDEAKKYMDEERNRMKEAEAGIEKGELCDKPKTKDYFEYFNRNYTGIPGIYFYRVLDKIIEYGNLIYEKGLILDYGCGGQHLRKRIREVRGQSNITGYDIVPELSDVKDYRKLKPSVIVCSGVLEHIQPSKLCELMQDFIKMKPRSIIVFLPTENIISRIGMKLTNHGYAHDDHVTNYKTANQIIEEHYEIKKRCYIMFRMAQITRYERRKT